MKKLLLVSLLLMLGALAYGQTNLPPCDPNNLPPNCTDYFGVANWANSPLPAGAITGFTVVSAGSGYVNPIVTITDTAGTGATNPTLTLDPTGGIVVTPATGGGGIGYLAPQITIVDMGFGWVSGPATCGAIGQPACGSGAIVTATIGAPLTTGSGIRKFMDALPDLKFALATPDTTTFPGADYYVIGLTQYTTKMHSDLPPTTLRGYCQLNGPGGLCAPSYLGPVILAAKNRPVRVLFKNLLPNGAGGNLFIPVDSTYMGAGSPYTQNRATLHLHGGATPWISDGTPHQWTAPSGEIGPQKGDSTQNVPDMWFDATGTLIPACAAQPTCATVGATNDPGAGAMTFFWTNQQGGRLMFYHDHAYGLTRLNVYAGEAAGYLLGDPQEEDALQAATVPGTLGAAIGGSTAPDLAHLIPLVIQDKTFVPSPAQLAAEDPTWVPGGFGTIPGSAHPGDLWFPHVYTPNQNPADVGGANAFGRWDYGPWTLPGNQTVLLAGTPTVGDVTIPCTSSAFPNQAVNCPITPNPSGTPESFMDTPLVNGKAYPVLHVAPEAYRFRILSAGNDRSWNLQFYVADPTVTTPDGRTKTEVKMVPAIEPGTGSLLPLCSTLTPITNTSLFMGLATAVLDGTGSPINGTGLPLNCWPNFGAGTQKAGIPIQQTMWAADGRFGGVPDPTTAGPAFIQIGTEGGLLPAPVVIPSMPTGYEANTRSVTITNVSVHGLWLGPAERADVVVDFSKFAGQTLILYNDAPTPAPAVDSRLDYFTGDGDQTPIGGAPNTLPGFGPNTRTIMQVIVDGTPSGKPFSLPALTKALPSIFAQTQPTPIVPEPTYPQASGGYSAIPTYSLITDASLTFFPIGSTTPVTYTDERKTIQELFSLDYGRMNATLGVELPLTNFLTQTTIPLGYIDPVTEVIDQGATQLWHITHNGVDTHFIHLHLFNVQVINRSAWDGTKRPPDQNELGWKDTVRMNPLEDILVALKPIQPLPPFPVRDSYRLMDVTMPAGQFCPDPANLNVNSPTPAPCSIFTLRDPLTNSPTNTPNALQNFGWEYVWHCHILGHEENDMMRAIAFNVPPEAPSNLTVASAVAPATGLNLAWIDNSASETGFTLERADDSAFTTNVVDQVVPPITGSTDGNGQGITWGGTQSFNDASAVGGFYRVRAFKPQASYWTSGTLTSPWSNTVSFGGAAASVSPAALNFGTWPLKTSSTPPLTATLSNTGTASFTYTATIQGANSGDFVVTSNPCGGTVAGGANCAISMMFTPSVTGPESASLSIATLPASPALTVALTGTGGGALPLLTITANNATMRYGSAVPPLTFTYSPVNPVGVTAPICTTTATNTNATPVGTYPITCSGATGNYTFSYVAGTMSVTPAPLTIWASNGAMIYGGVPPAITASYVGLVAGDTPATFAVAPNLAPICITTPTLTQLTPVGIYPSSCSGAADPNYTISYATGKVTVAKAALSITSTVSRIYGTPNPLPIPPTPTGLVNGDTLASAGIVVSCSTTPVTTSPVGTYPITCTGPASTASYIITYVPGTLTVNPAIASVTPNAASKVYGTADPVFTGTLTGFLPADNVTATYTRTLGETVAGSPYTISAALTPATVLSNYTITYNTAAFTITPKGASITLNPATKVYGSADPVPLTTSTLTGFTAADQALLTVTYTRTAGENVGTYPMNATVGPAAVAANYTISVTPANFSITPLAASVTPIAASKVYGAADPVFTGTLTGFLPADNVTATYTRTPGETVAGSPYTISATLAPAAVSTNYTITYNTAAFTITPKGASITLNPATKVYGSADPVPLTTSTLTGFTAADQALLTVTYTRTAGENVGTYPMNATVGPAAVAANYTISVTPANFSITPLAASVTPIAASKVYGTADPVFTGTLTGFLLADNVTATYTRTLGETVAGSPYTISAALTPATVLSNYTITYNTANFTITPLAASVTPIAASKVYGTVDPVFSGTLAGFLPADAVTATYTRTAGENVGTYTISATLAPAGVLGNYAITYNTAAFTITPKAASIVLNPDTKVYGSADPVPLTTSTLTGFTAADQALLTVTYARTAGENVGTYPMNATVGPAAVAANYTIIVTPANFSITPKSLTLTANNATKVYGAPLPAFTVTGTGFVNGDSVASLTGTLSCTTATAISPVGPYPINCSGLSSPNYTITYAPGTLTVTPAALTITAPNATRIWGFANPVFTPTATGLVNPPDTLASLGVTCASTATATSAIGSYPITCSGVTSANYITSYVPGTLTVTTAVQLTPASLTFASQNVGTTSPFQTATLRNIGGSTITFSAAITLNFIRGGAGGGTCGTTLAAAATCTINVRFRPTTTGVLTGTLTIASALAGSGVVALSGTGNGAVAAVSPATTTVAPYNFGNVTRGQVSAPLTVTVTNRGSTPMTFNAANAFTLGGNTAHFRLTTGGSCVNGGTLPALGSCSITLTFAPTAGTARNTKNVTVTIRSNATNGNQFLYARGTAQ